MLSILSSVPPVWPRPRPEIIGTKQPQAAAIRATRKLTLSPMPPVECLSTTGPPRSLDHSRVVPECAIALVSAAASLNDRDRRRVVPERAIDLCSSAASSNDRERRQIAMASAATCSGGMLPSARPRTKNPICSAESVPPSRLARMTSTNNIDSPGEESYGWSNFSHLIKKSILIHKLPGMHYWRQSFMGGCE